MSIKSKLIIAAAVATFGLATPALAQSFTAGAGTGNVIASYFEANGSLHNGAAGSQETQITVRHGEHDSFAMAPGAGSAANRPAATGGASIGYNEMLLVH